MLLHSFTSKKFYVFGSIYVSLFNSNYRSALHESSFKVWGLFIISVSIETIDLMIEDNMTGRMFSSFLPQR
jgi:hypothetical protein